MVNRSYIYTHWSLNQKYMVYGREYHNYTNKLVWIQDAQGHIVSVHPFQGDPHREYARDTVTIVTIGKTETENPPPHAGAIPDGAYYDAHPSMSKPIMAGNTDLRVLKSETRVGIEKLTSQVGMLLEKEDLYISAQKIGPNNCHPKLHGDDKLGTLISDGLGQGVYIEIVTNSGKTDAMYMPFMGKVVCLVPTLAPDAEEEGVVIHEKSPHNTEPNRSVYPLEKFMNGEGFMGIRLYRSYLEAEHDDNCPQRKDLSGKEEEWLKNREKELKKAREEGHKAAINEVTLQRRALEEKERKIERDTIALHEKRRSDKVGFFGYLAKAASTALGFLKSLIF